MTAKNNQKRKADDIVVPGLAADAAERKRVLNVLAQRRYSTIPFRYSRRPRLLG